MALKPKVDELTAELFGNVVEGEVTALERWQFENEVMLAELGTEEAEADLDPLEILIRRESAGEFLFHVKH